MLTRPAPLRRRSIGTTVGAAVLALALTVGCGSAGSTAPGPPAPTADTGYPVSVMRCGHTTTFTEAPRRVLLGFPTSIRTLDALGVADRAIGYVTGSFASPPEGFSLPEVSPEYLPSKEVVIAARPDLFLSNDENQVSGADGTPSYTDLDAQGAGAFVLGNYCVDNPAPATLDAVYADVRDLGSIFGVARRADGLVTELTGRVQAAAAGRGASTAPEVALVQVVEDKVFALSGSYYNAVVAGAGATNVFAGLGQNFAEISTEQVLTATPDALFVAYDGAQDGAAAAVAQARAAFASSSAVAANKVFPLSNGEISGGGINIISVTEEVATALYGG